MVSDDDFTLSADFYGEIVIAAGNTSLSGKGAAIAAPQYHKKERSSDDWRGSRPKFRSRADCSLPFSFYSSYRRDSDVLSTLMIDVEIHCSLKKRIRGLRFPFPPF